MSGSVPKMLTALGTPYSAYPRHPLREVLTAMTGAIPPHFVRGYNTDTLTELEHHKLQEWAVNNVKPSWLTGIGLIEAAEKQIDEAVGNGNIPPPPGKV